MAIVHELSNFFHGFFVLKNSEAHNDFVIKDTLSHLSVGFGKPYNYRKMESIEEKKHLSIGYAPILMLGLKMVPKQK